MPAVDAVDGVLIVEEVVRRVDKLLESLDIYLAIVLILQHLADKGASVCGTPVKRILAARVALHAAVV